MVYKLKKIGVWPTAKLCAALYGAMYFLLGLFIWVASFFSGEAERSTLFGIGGVGVIPILTIVGLVAGFLFGAISAFLYNLFAGFIGGVELELEEKTEEKE